MYFQQCCEHTTHSISVILKLVSLLFSSTYFLLRLLRRSSVLILRAPRIPPARTLVSLISPVCALVEPMACVYFSSRMARSVAWRQRHKAWPAAAAGIVPRRGVPPGSPGHLPAWGVNTPSQHCKTEHTNNPPNLLQDEKNNTVLVFVGAGNIPYRSGYFNTSAWNSLWLGFTTF